jgi:hypothetical protein
VLPLILDADQADTVRLVQNVFQQPLRLHHSRCGLGCGLSPVIACTTARQRLASMIPLAHDVRRWNVPIAIHTPSPIPFDIWSMSAKTGTARLIAHIFWPFGNCHSPFRPLDEPARWVNKSSNVIARSAASVSPSGPSGDRNTRICANSGA